MSYGLARRRRFYGIGQMEQNKSLGTFYVLVLTGGILALLYIGYDRFLRKD